MDRSEKTSPDKNNDRRRRSRLNGTTPGWVIPDNGDFSNPNEVRVRDVSRHGVGFESTERIKDGEVVRLRIGRGPIELAKRIRVVRCNPGQDGNFTIGGEFL